MKCAQTDMGGREGRRHSERGRYGDEGKRGMKIGEDRAEGERGGK